MDREKIAGEYADSILNSIPIERGDEPEHDEYDDEPRKSPTLTEIESLRLVRQSVPDDVKAELVRGIYTEKYDDEDEDTGAEFVNERKHYRTEIKLTIPHEFGEKVRYLILKSE